MRQLTINQMSPLNGGDWRGELLCGTGLGALAGYSLSLMAVPVAGAAIYATTALATVVIGMSCHGWFS